MRGGNGEYTGLRFRHCKKKLSGNCGAIQSGTNMIEKALLLLVMAVLCNSIKAASFDCSNADTKVENIVCSNGLLSKLDSQLATAYQLAVNNAYPIKKPSLIAEQRGWLKTVRNKCNDEDCLIRAYTSRIRTLTLITTGKSKANFMVDATEQEEVISVLQDHLTRTGIAARFSSCKYIVTLVHESPYGQDESFGAICTLNGRPVEVCGDTLIGKLAINFGAFGESGGNVADFTKANCPRGG